MYCVKCGSQMPDTARFCTKCGAPAKPPAPVPAPQPQPAPVPAPQPQPAMWQPMPQPGPLPASPVRYAGFWRRFLAAVIDGAVFGLLWFVLAGVYEFGTALVLERTAFAPDGAGLLRTLWLVGAGRWLLFALLVFVLFALAEASSRGASLGKRALGLRVTTVDGQRAGIVRATARIALKPLSAAPLMLGFLMAGVSGRKQALHDIMSGSVVVRI